MHLEGVVTLLQYQCDQFHPISLSDERFHYIAVIVNLVVDKGLILRTRPSNK